LCCLIFCCSFSVCCVAAERSPEKVMATAKKSRIGFMQRPYSREKSNSKLGMSRHLPTRSVRSSCSSCLQFGFGVESLIQLAARIGVIKRNQCANCTSLAAVTQVAEKKLHGAGAEPFP